MRALYSAATGMAAQQTRLDSIANNLANVQTTSFKKSRESFQDLYYQELTHGGLDMGSAHVEVGSGVKLAEVAKDFSMGSPTDTGRELDVAIEGRGFFEVQGPGGERFFTRDGHFTLNANGELITASGLSLGGIQIPEDVVRVRIEDDGAVQGEMSDGRQFALGRLQLADFMNPSGLRSVGGNMYQQSSSSGEPMPVEAGQDGINIRQYAL
jgi:flagellar basal-body rod protein FlgG